MYSQVRCDSHDSKEMSDVSLASNCKVMLVTQSAAVAYITRWSRESVKHRGSGVRVSFIGYINCIKFCYGARQWYRSHIS